MEKRIEKWESLRLVAQQFAPQEYITQCDSTKEFHIEPFNTGCDSGSVRCIGDDHETSVHFSHSSRIKFNPAGAPSPAEFWEKAADLVSSPDFEVLCGNTVVGISKVIGRGSNNIDEVNWGNIDSDWKTGFCGMAPNNWGNSNATVVLSADWRILFNISG